MNVKRVSGLFIIMMVAILAISKSSKAQLVSFPGAEGAGKFTTGGRGTSTQPTTVFLVTSLSDANTPGTLRYACAASTATYPYRTIVFRISGTIHLLSKLSIPANTTVAGQTAPGDGICLADWPVVMGGNNIIFRYVRCRMGDKNQKKVDANGNPVDGSGGDDALGDLSHKNLIVDHCSVSWSDDEALTIYRGDSVTMQWNFITEPLNYSYHFETGDADYEQHGYGGIQGGRHASIHHNLYAHCRNRTPRFAGSSTYSPAVQGSDMADYRNNVIYNWGIDNVYGGEGGYYNMVNNYIKPGPSTTSRKTQIVAVDSGEGFPYAKYFLTGNYITSSTTNSNNNWVGVTMKSGKLSDTVYSKVTTPFDLPPFAMETALDAYNSVLASGGCSLPRRDTLDQRIVNDVKNGTGKIIDVQGNYPHGTPYDQTVNAWPTLNSTTPPTDSDSDGMPDSWETSHGLNSNNAVDRNGTAPDGYTWLEEYLNDIVAQGVLPLNLVSFTASSGNNQVLVQWSTVNEINSKSFEVERSNDGQTFASIITVEARSSTAQNAYSFTDINPIEGTSYYRLKMIDKDGGYTYSKVVTLNTKLLTRLTVFPNPAYNTLSITYAKANDQSYLQVVSVDGRKMISQKIHQNSTQMTVDVSSLTPGTFLISVNTGSEILSASFIKK